MGRRIILHCKKQFSFVHFAEFLKRFLMVISSVFSKIASWEAQTYRNFVTFGENAEKFSVKKGFHRDALWGVIATGALVFLYRSYQGFSPLPFRAALTFSVLIVVRAEIFAFLRKKTDPEALYWTSNTPLCAMLLLMHCTLEMTCVQGGLNALFQRAPLPRLSVTVFQMCGLKCSAAALLSIVTATAFFMRLYKAQIAYAHTPPPWDVWANATIQQISLATVYQFYGYQGCLWIMMIKLIHSELRAHFFSKKPRPPVDN
jgi:hypothetical protein